MSYPPTPEQQDAIDAFNTGDDMVIEAGAGTGKTSTLKFLAAAQPGKRIIYLAYNKSIATEAQAAFPGNNVRAMTAHSLAFRWLRESWGAALPSRLKAPRMRPWDTAKLLGANKPLILTGGNLGARVIQPNQQSSLAQQTVVRFCYSDDDSLRAKHVPQVPGVDNTGDRADLVAAILPMAHRAWQDLSRPGGVLFFPHDVYVKLYALSKPTIDCDALFLDEAQDTNPALAGIVNGQGHAQRAATGDANQAIYGWRGAEDFLSKMDAKHHLYLTQSFRFGPAVADEANKWLMLLDSKLRLKGAPESVITSAVATVKDPDAILCRTNAEAVSRVIDCHTKGQPVALVGSGEDVKKLAKAADDLKAKGSTSHPELCAFTSWGDVQDYTENDAAGADLKVAVKLIDDYGTAAIIDAIDRTVPEGAKGAVTVSTAHKSKGREWDKVLVAPDFREPQDDEFGEPKLPSREDMMLAYVTVTRAQKVLDAGGLSWVDNYLPGGIKSGSPRLTAPPAPKPEPTKPTDEDKGFRIIVPAVKTGIPA